MDDPDADAADREVAHGRADGAPVSPAQARECAESAWGWTLAQVRWDDDGPWVPVRVPLGPVEREGLEPAPDRDEVYQGIGGLGLALAEVQLTREWTQAEQSLADHIVARLRRADLGGDCGLYTGLAGSLTVIRHLGGGGDDALVATMGELATPLGWPAPEYGHEPVNDLLMGTAGIVLALLSHGGAEATRLAHHGADALRATARPTPRGVRWKMYEGDRDRFMPNYSHGTAGIAAALAVAGRQLERADLVELARLGAEELVASADTVDGGFRAPLQIPPAEGYADFCYGWCHGPTGTVNLFGALELAGVAQVAGRAPAEWRAAAARSLSRSGVPERRFDGFWDNDGRCCGTAGVLDAVLNLVQATRSPADLAFADTLAAAVVERSEAAPAEPQQRFWRFYEHRVDPPYLDPGVGWMQGAAGIAAALFRYARVRESGVDATRLALPDDWWMAPSSLPA
jgi:lantibiotic modifying enzyme